MTDINEKIKKFIETNDTTGDYYDDDISENKFMALLAYLPFLVLIPLFFAKESKFARYHANQGMILFVIELASWILFGILGWIPFIGWIFKILDALVTVACFLLAIVGIYNAFSGKARELPFVGSIIIIK